MSNSSPPPPDTDTPSTDTPPADAVTTSTTPDTAPDPAPSTEPRPDAAPAVAEAAEAVAAPTPPDPAEERRIALDALAWCRAHPSEETAVETVNTVFALESDPDVHAPLIEAAVAVVDAVSALEEPAPALHAHMTVLMANLLSLRGDRDVVDRLFAAWMRNAHAYGDVHATPPAFQRGEFVQQVADLLGWGALDPKNDRKALERFARWVDTWAPKNKFRVRRVVDAISRNFGPPDVWNLVRYPNDRPDHRPDHRHGRGPKKPQKE
ncbi:MAG: hypothetical protein R3A52_07190 [Polyangiales bacterium]